MSSAMSACSSAMSFKFVHSYSIVFLRFFAVSGRGSVVDQSILLFHLCQQI